MGVLLLLLLHFKLNSFLSLSLVVFKTCGISLCFGVICFSYILLFLFSCCCYCFYCTVALWTSALLHPLSDFRIESFDFALFADILLYGYAALVYIGD